MADRKLTVGVWLEEGYSRDVGGGFSYYQTLVNAIDRYPFLNGNVVFVGTVDMRESFSKPIYHLSADDQPSGLSKSFRSALQRIRRRITRTSAPPNRKERVGDALAEMVRQKGIDLIYFPVPTSVMEVDVPYIATSWDLGHRTSHAFPEFGQAGRWEWREKTFQRIYGKALFVFCESTAGKKELIKYFRVFPGKVGVVPLFPADYMSRSLTEQENEHVCRTHRLEPLEFFLYPAQFWAHKNHHGLLKAFAILAESYPNLKLVFTGSDKGNLGYIKNLVASYQLQERVVFTGFVENDELVAFYGFALALVMPSFLGPTNMPLLEALESLCPVVCSNHSGHEELLGDAALYVDPLAHEDLAAAMAQMMNPDFRAEQVRRLEIRKRESRFTTLQAMKAIDGMLPRIAALRHCWQ